MTRVTPRFVFVVAAIGVTASCGGGSVGAQGPQSYQEYECPAPIGKIVREDCSRQALKYDGASFQGSIGVAQVGASGAYRDQAIREADGLVQMLKEQRVSLCNDFNTCKVTVPEYRADQGRIDDSFIALMALKDKMAALDARGAAFLLEEINKIRLGRSAAAGGAPAASTPAAAAPEGTSVAATPASSGLAGSYEISAAANPGGRGSYAGSVTLIPRGNVFDVNWEIRNGTPYKGVGIVVANVLCVGWSTTQAEKIGIAAYQNGDTRLDGAWTMSGMGGETGTEILEGPSGLNGSYQISRGQFGNAPPYTGAVSISPTGAAWAVHWSVGAEQTDGIGIRVGKVFAVGYGLPGQRDIGVVAYEIQGRTLTGKWATLNGSELGLENLAKR